MTIAIIIAVAGAVAGCLALHRDQDKTGMKRIVLKDSDFFEEP